MSTSKTYLFVVRETRDARPTPWLGHGVSRNQALRRLLTKTARVKAVIVK